MKQYAVKITNKALSDMNAIYGYIAESLQNPIAAIGQYNRIAEAIEPLDILPTRCRLFDTQPEHDLVMRRLQVDNYSVVYVVEESVVTVLRVLYSSSDFISRLREG